MTVELYDEVHELRPRPGRQTEWLLVGHGEDYICCRFEGTWASGWDYPAEYEFIPL